MFENVKEIRAGNHQYKCFIKKIDIKNKNWQIEIGYEIVVIFVYFQFATMILLMI